MDATLEERLTDCIEQLRSCLLEDPAEAPDIDLTPIYAPASLPQPRTVARESAVIVESAVETAEANVAQSNHFTESGAVSGLGAWGDLGQ